MFLRIFGKVISSFLLFFLGLFTAGVLSLLILIFFVNTSKYVEIPYLTGENKDVAIKSLEEKGLIPNIVGNGNTVLYTEPGHDVKVKTGHHVIVQMRNIEKQKVPDLLNIPLEVAEQFLTEFNIKYDIQKISTYQKDKNGLIVNVSPSPGNEILNDTIILSVGVYEGVEK
ncbi:MAG: eukaryotic-like serine/threonine-protein kinase [Oceanotoga sp.]|jgi:serine/threonine-protein kinase|nr:eukaryotic-like serine/threonine-protein kinase [Oceanotoga sp.]